MGVSVNFQIKDFITECQSYPGGSNPFCTFKLMDDGSSVTVFLHSVEEARKLVDAAEATYINALNNERERQRKEIMGDLINPAF